MTDETGSTTGDATGPIRSERFADDGRRYRLDSRIATGGMGEVWRATDTTLGREVAVKLLKHEFADDATFRSRFETEARHAAALHHPGVAGVYDFGEAVAGDGSGQPRPFLVMELVDGKPLSDLLAGGRALDPEVARDLLAQAADAVAVAHAAGIVHRDIKPANLLVTPERQIKITDFGIARAADGVGITQTGQVMGTPQYLSPEQARGNPATTASDVYSLGCVAFECLVGRRPFQAESPIATALAHLQQPVPELPDDVPADLAVVVRRALAKEPAERYPDAAAFAAALRDPAAAAATQVVAPAAAPPVDAQGTQVMAAVPLGTGPATVSTPVSTPVSPPGEAARRTPWVPILVVLLVLLLAAGAFALLRGGDGTEEPTTPTSSTGERVVIDESDFVGRPVDTVVDELTTRGLRVDTIELDNPGNETAGLVDGVDPSGRLRVGDLVEVTYWGDAPTEEPTQEPTPEPTEEPTQQPTEVPTQEPTLPPTEVPTQEPTQTTPPQESSPPAPAQTTPPAVAEGSTAPEGLTTDSTSERESTL